MEVIIEILIPVILLSVMALVFGLVLSIAYKKLAVKPDEKLAEIREHLPGANCGGCGYAGCDAFASALADGKAKISSCAVCSAEQREAISAVMGVEAESTEKMVARVHCAGGTNCLDRYDYYGVKDCEAASAVTGGPKMCSFGCVGMGTCVKHCPFGAISIGANGVAVVDASVCTGCGTCVSSCPKKIISLIPADGAVNVACSGREKGKTVKDKCKRGCLACGLCAKVCPENAIMITDNLPSVDYSKCAGCNACADKCPSHSIVRLK